MDQFIELLQDIHKLNILQCYIKSEQIKQQAMQIEKSNTLDDDEIKCHVKAVKFEPFTVKSKQVDIPDWTKNLWSFAQHIYVNFMVRNDHKPFKFSRIGGKKDEIIKYFQFDTDDNIIKMIKNCGRCVLAQDANKKQNNYYQYWNDPDGWWVDFANNYLGGSYKTDGFVQEEKMFYIFPELIGYTESLRKDGSNPKIDQEDEYAKQSHIVIFENVLKVLESEQTEDKRNFYGKNTTAFNNDWEKISKIIGEVVVSIVSALACIDELKKILQKKSFELTEDQKKIIEQINKESKTIGIETHPTFHNIIAINAKKYTEIPIQYEQQDLLTLATKLFIGFAHVPCGKLIHTGKLGCGAFFNDVGTIIALQLIVAYVLGKKIVIYGIDDNEKPELLSQNKYSDEYENSFYKHDITGLYPPSWKIDEKIKNIINVFIQQTPLLQHQKVTEKICKIIK